MISLLLIREEEDNNNTKGKLELFNSMGKMVFECYTLELPWKDNKKSISCISPGEYDVKLHDSPSLGKVIEIQDVQDRKYIYFHRGNFVSGEEGPNQVRGCILVGDGFEDINYDGIEDITNSKKTFLKLISLMDEDTHSLVIRNDI